MPQGYTESPSVYAQELGKNLEGFKPPGGGTLIQYVDDLLLCSTTRQSCEQDTKALLLFLAQNGHKASKAKLQLVKQEVQYLGHVLNHLGRRLGLKRVEGIRKAPIPDTKRQLMKWMGMVGYCRPWIQDFAERSQPLLDLMHGGQGLRPNDRLDWTTKAETAFSDLKQALCDAPALGVPNFSKPFQLYVDEWHGFMTAVLGQIHGDRLRPIVYYSKRLDTVASSLPACLRAVAATAEAVLMSADLVQMHPLVVHTSHAVHALITQAKTSHLTTARLIHYQNILLTLSNVTLQRCSTINPATLLPTEMEGSPHDCVEVAQSLAKPRSDLGEDPLPNSGFIFVDGCSLRLPDGSPSTSYAVVASEGQLLSGGKLPSTWSAQAAELFALAQACRQFAGEDVTIFTDSRYAFGVCHNHGALWKQRGFLTSTGKPIQHHELVRDLLSAIQLPHSIAVVKCKAHTGCSDPVSIGNSWADWWAKRAALHTDAPVALMPSRVLHDTHTLLDVQSGVTEGELGKWKKDGVKGPDGLWRQRETQLPFIPKSAYPGLARMTHGLDHASKTAMVEMLAKRWAAPGFSAYAQEFVKRCCLCAQHNVGRPVSVTQSVTKPSEGPFRHLQMDFIELTPCRGYKYCLVIIDLFSRWPEVFPCRRADALSVAKNLLREILPRWGVPGKLTTDNGSHFANQVIRHLGQWLGIDLKHYCAYHPQSGGIVERANQTIKVKLAKLCAETGLDWVTALPLVLTAMRGRTHSGTGLAPFEVLTGRPMPLPYPGGTLTLETVDGDLLPYVSSLQISLKRIHSQIRAAQVGPEPNQPETIGPGEWILIKDLRRKHWHQPRGRSSRQHVLLPLMPSWNGLLLGTLTPRTRMTSVCDTRMILYQRGECSGKLPPSMMSDGY
ncbi:protein NYNRIN-like [Paramormyrops kingsleyae]|uniref:protein NYNRIN-like n=1 Tax=Paramormyrops kingsleyae TaxID=1676925 RepID=UPI003B96E9AF